MKTLNSYIQREGCSSSASSSLNEVHSPPRVRVPTCPVLAPCFLHTMHSAASLSGAMARFRGKREVLLWKRIGECNTHGDHCGGSSPQVSEEQWIVEYHFSCCSHHITSFCVLLDCIWCFRCVWFLTPGSWAWWNTVTTRSWDRSEPSLWILISSGRCSHTKQTVNSVWKEKPQQVYPVHKKENIESVIMSELYKCQDFKPLKIILQYYQPVKCVSLCYTFRFHGSNQRLDDICDFRSTKLTNAASREGLKPFRRSIVSK